MARRIPFLVISARSISEARASELSSCERRRAFHCSAVSRIDFIFATPRSWCKSRTRAARSCRILDSATAMFCSISIAGIRHPWSLWPAAPFNKRRETYIAIPSITLDCVTRRQPFSRFIEQLADERTPHRTVRPSNRPDGIQLQEFLHLVPSDARDDRLMQPWISRAFMANFTNVDRVAQQSVKCPTRERLRTRPRAIARDAKLGVQTIAVEFFFEQPHAAELAVALEDVSDRFRFQNRLPPTADHSALCSRAEPNLPSTFLCAWKLRTCLECAHRLPRARTVQTTATRSASGDPSTSWC